MADMTNGPTPNRSKEVAGAVDLNNAAMRPAPRYSPRGVEIDIKGAPNLRGYISLPTNDVQDAKYPALLILGGSEGGIWKWLIDDWAHRGYVALGVAYHKGYNEPGAELTTEQALHKEGLVLDGWSKVPDALHNIEISAFEKARARLMSHEAVANNYKPALIGTSRGGELALLLGTTYPEAFRAIVALVPCGTVQRGSSWNPSYKDRSNIKA